MQDCTLYHMFVCNTPQSLHMPIVRQVVYSVIPPMVHII